MNLQTAHPDVLNRRQRPRHPDRPTRSHWTWYFGVTGISTCRIAPAQVRTWRGPTIIRRTSPCGSFA